MENTPSEIPNPFFTYVATSATLAEFVTYWSAQYRYDGDALEYEKYVGVHPQTREGLLSLFVWKNGGKLSSKKLASVERNYVSVINDSRLCNADITVDEFLTRVPKGGAVWRIFWLHVCHPRRFPIYDQHVHRAMRYLMNLPITELEQYSERAVIRAYVDEYLPFHARFSSFPERTVDQALWAFGKFIKRPAVPLPARVPQCRDA